MSKNLFNSVKLFKPKKNVFDLTHDVKLSGNPGYLIPTLAMECIPGDKISIGCDSIVRLAPLVSPMMHRMDVFMHYFFIPNRLVWPGWENYITNTKVAGALPAFPTFLIKQDGTNYTKLMDYLGIPNPTNKVGTGVDETVSAIPAAMYQLIYNEYYRDQNLESESDYLLNDGDNTATNPNLWEMKKRCWEHDFLTGALPFAQKGDAVSIPIGDIVTKDPASGISFVKSGSGLPADNGDIQTQGSILEDSGGDAIVFGSNNLEVAPTNINDLRRAYRLQEWLERAALGGTRYVESILSFFGVKSPDARLQRPEYITGTKSPIVISEVLQTGATGSGATPQGNMAGHGVALQQGRYGGYFVQEHGYVIGIMSVRPKTAYMQNIPKHFLKTSNPFEFFFPQFANIGEQPVELREVCAYAPGGTSTFGYVPRYAEYKYMQNRVCGEFATSLDYWHMARKFSGSLPSLNAQFVQCNPTYRVFAVDDDAVDHLYCQVLHKIKAVRGMPVYGTPTI